MADNSSHHDDDLDVSFIKNPDVSHEESDVRIKPIVVFGISLLIASAIIYVGLFGLFKYFEKRSERAELPPSPLAGERAADPPEPRLQLIPSHKIHPLDEWKQMRAEEEAALNDYGWIDQKTGVVRLPIEKAKELALERGLLKSSRPAPQNQQPSGAQSEATGQSSGRSSGQASSEQAMPSGSSSGRTPERRNH